MTAAERNTRYLLGLAVALILIGLMAATLLAFSEPARAATVPQRGNRLLSTLEAEYGLPDGLLDAVQAIESGRRNVVAYGRGKGGKGADVGPWQIHVPDVRSDAGQRAWWYLRQPAVNASVAAYLLARSRQQCLDKDSPLSRSVACRRCPEALYNTRSDTWCGKLRRQMAGGG